MGKVILPMLDESLYIQHPDTRTSAADHYQMTLSFHFTVCAEVLRLITEPTKFTTDCLNFWLLDVAYTRFKILRLFYRNEFTVRDSPEPTLS